MTDRDTIKLLKECDAGSKMAVSSLDDVMDKVENENLKKLLNETEAFPKACVISIDEKERNKNRGADEEQKRFVFCLFSVNKPEKKRKAETDYITAENVHWPMNTEIES